MKKNILVPIEYIETVTFLDESGAEVTEEVTRVRYEAQNVEMTAEEIAEIESQANSPQAIAQEIESLKGELASTDYKAIKYAEGYYTDEEFAPIKAHRQELRDRINELEGRV